MTCLRSRYNSTKQGFSLQRKFHLNHHVISHHRLRVRASVRFRPLDNVVVTARGGMLPSFPVPRAAVSSRPLQNTQMPLACTVNGVSASVNRSRGGVRIDNRRPFFRPKKMFSMNWMSGTRIKHNIPLLPRKKKGDFYELNAQSTGLLRSFFHTLREMKQLVSYASRTRVRTIYYK